MRVEGAERAAGAAELPLGAADAQLWSASPVAEALLVE